MKSRPLMVVTCLLITAVLIASKFYKPHYSSDNIVSYLQKIDSSSLICQGWIYSAPKMNSDGNMRLLIDLGGCLENGMIEPVEGHARLTIASPGQGKLSYGDIIRFKTHLKIPTDFKNPGGFKFKRYCLASRIDVLGFIDDPKWLVKIGVVENHIVRRLIESWREKIDASLSAAIPDKNVRSVARALAIGDGASIPEEIRDDFKRSGLIHILVISGLNVGFVAIAIFFFLRWIFVFVPRLAVRANIFKFSAVGTIIGVWLYAYIAGAEVSVVRAAVMATVYLAGIILDKRQDIFTSLALAAVIIIADSPLAIYDISFQLSFIAVLAIALIYPAMAERIKYLQNKPGEGLVARAGRGVLQTLAVSIAATIGVGPLLAFYFHNLSLVGIFANVVVVPWAGFIVTPAGLIVSAISVISKHLAYWPIVIWGHLIQPVISAADIAAGIGKPLMIAYTPPKLAVLMFYHIAIFAVLWRYMRHAKYAVLGCSLVLIGSIVLHQGWFMPKHLEITFLDVGQGSSAVARFPNGRVMVVDGGGSAKSDFDIGKFVIAPYLWHEGINKVDLLVATHQHPDHFNGLGFLAEEFKPKALLWNGVMPDDEEREEWDAFVQRVKQANVPMETNFNFDGGDVKVEILSPPAKIPPEWNMNNTSIAMRISYGEASFLLTGDIEAEAEAQMKDEGRGTRDEQTTVLQVPHHGSATSSTSAFLEAIRPKYAIIQCGENNRYGFPKDEVVERLEKIGAEIFRTDINGAVRFKTDSHRIETKKFVK